MNAKNSHCMNRMVILAAAMAIFATAAQAQQRAFDRETDKLIWLNGDNAAGLRANVSDNISYAELFGGMEKGGFKHSYEAPSLWTAGAEARTVMHLDNFSMKGGFSFEQMEGRDMCGSMFTNPGYYPVDALEFTPGRKTRQAYAFDGAVSVDLGSNWRLGAGLDFESSNCAKLKDLRYTDYRLDMKFTAGLTYSAGDHVFGLDYIYSKNSETPDPEQIGTGESSYYAFLDKGQFYGKNEVWSGSGVHLDENGVAGFPLKEHFNGAGLQWAYRGMYLIDVEYLYGKGSAGEKQFIWYRFPSHNLSVKLVERVDYGTKTLSFKETVGFRQQKNSETVIEKISTNGVTTTTEYGSNDILERRKFTVDLRMDVLRDAFDYGIFAHMSEDESLASQVYPYLTDQLLDRTTLGAYGTFRSGKFEFGPELRFTYGSISEASRVVEESVVSSAPFRLEDWYRLEAEYDTASSLFAKAFVRFNFANGLYIQGDASLSKAFGIEYLGGDTRTACTARLGWTF